MMILQKGHLTNAALSQRANIITLRRFGDENGGAEVSRVLRKHVYKLGSRLEQVS